MEDAGTERGWRCEGTAHSASGPILLDHHGISVQRTQRATSPESETLFFYCLLYQDARCLFSWILSIYLSIY
jgi:hypothetical protein